VSLMNELMVGHALLNSRAFSLVWEYRDRSQGKSTSKNRGFASILVHNLNGGMNTLCVFCILFDVLPLGSRLIVSRGGQRHKIRR